LPLVLPPIGEMNSGILSDLLLLSHDFYQPVTVS
jgi:hypothetical protein